MRILNLKNSVTESFNQRIEAEISKGSFKENMILVVGNINAKSVSLIMKMCDMYSDNNFLFTLVVTNKGQEKLLKTVGAYSILRIFSSIDDAKKYIEEKKDTEEDTDVSAKTVIIEPDLFS